MYNGKKISVVVPAYNEELLVGRVIETMPDFIDFIVVIDDCSKDHTSDVVKSYQQENCERLVLIRNTTNQGVGGAVLSGHRWAMDHCSDISVVMAGDAQMDPHDLKKIIEPVISGEVDFSKGNRFISGEAWNHMPKLRYFANAGLSMLNKIAMGYWHISDPQCGYTAISCQALQKLDLSRIKRGYQFENSLLLWLNINRMRVIDIPIHAVYGNGEKSGINHYWALLLFSKFLFESFFFRLKEKYVIRDFHPLVFFYIFGLLFFVLGLGLGTYLFFYRILINTVQTTSALFATFLFTTGLQFLLFAMWFDKDYEKKP